MSAILLSSAIVASSTMLQDTDAYTGQGNYVKKTNSKGVCGDKLCSEYEGGRSEYEAKKAAASKAIGEKIAELAKPDESKDKRITTENQNLKEELENILKKLELGMSLSEGEIQMAKKAMMNQLVKISEIKHTTKKLARPKEPLVLHNMH